MNIILAAHMEAARWELREQLRLHPDTGVHDWLLVTPNNPQRLLGINLKKDDLVVYNATYWRERDVWYSKHLQKNRQEISRSIQMLEALRER